MVPTVILTIIAVPISGTVLVGAGIESSECKGKLTLIAPCGMEMNYFKNESKIDFNAAKVKVEGCSCFRLFERQDFRGKSFLVTKGRKKKVTFRVRSLARVICPRQLKRRSITKKNNKLLQ